MKMDEQCDCSTRRRPGAKRGQHLLKQRLRVPPLTLILYQTTMAHVVGEEATSGIDVPPERIIHDA
jgi:hypothetical protein